MTTHFIYLGKSHDSRHKSLTLTISATVSMVKMTECERKAGLPEIHEREADPAWGLPLPCGLTFTQCISSVAQAT